MMIGGRNRDSKLFIRMLVITGEGVSAGHSGSQAHKRLETDSQPNRHRETKSQRHLENTRLEVDRQTTETERQRARDI